MKNQREHNQFKKLTMSSCLLLIALATLAAAQNYTNAACVSAETQCTKLKSKGFIFTSRAVPSNWISPYDSQQPATSPIAAATPLPTATAFYNYNLTSGNQSCGYDFVRFSCW